MAITSRGKLENLISSGKADADMLNVLQQAENKHNEARSDFRKKRENVDNSRNRVAIARENLNKISILHPIRRMRARRHLRNMVASLRTSEALLNMSRTEYRSSMQTLREIRRTIRSAERVSREQESLKRMIPRRVKEAQKLGISIPATLMTELNNVMNGDPGMLSMKQTGNTYLNPVNTAGYRQLIGLINEKQVEIGKEKIKQASGVVVDVAKKAVEKVKELGER